MSISSGNLKTACIPLPPLDDQYRIVAILDKADAIRRKRREAVALTEQLLRSTFLEMFGDPGTNPNSWPIEVMRELVCDSQYGTATKANERGQGLPVLRMNNITADGWVDLTSLKWVELGSEELSKCTVRRGDLMFNRTNSPELVGKTAVWHSDDVYALAGYLVRIRFHSDKANADYVSGFLNSGFGKRYLFERAKPSNNMSNFSAGEFMRIPIPVPPIDAQRRYAKVAENIRACRRQLDAAANEADNLFNSLVQRAFRGEL